VVALDCGQVVNPNILEQQIQGAVVFGLANVLRAQITIDKGRVVQGNFDDYAPMRMEETPAVEVYIVPSTEAPKSLIARSMSMSLRTEPSAMPSRSPPPTVSAARFSHIRM